MIASASLERGNLIHTELLQQKVNWYELSDRKLQRDYLNLLKWTESIQL
jgi:hypothetical protein